jgi:tRNA1Val (adenine37-N6)-methyltransferase
LKAEGVFRFKKFEIHHSASAMKVGTDGVLLGALAHAHNPQAILDIGSGTGLIALMLAQRFLARIHAVEIDKDAATEAVSNAQNSPWHERIEIFHAPFQDFYQNPPFEKYQLIVSNPPFFTNSLQGPFKQRNQARHTHSLPFAALLQGVVRLLDEKGLFWIILPCAEAFTFIASARDKGLYCRHQLKIKPNPQKEAHRLVMAFGKQQGVETAEEICIESGNRHEYSEQYIALTRDFYLKM